MNKLDQILNSQAYVRGHFYFLILMRFLLITSRVGHLVVPNLVMKLQRTNVFFFIKIIFFELYIIFFELYIIFFVKVLNY